MKLSVLVTTYNLEEYIDETLQSIFDQQTEFEYEVIIGDDGSTDQTIPIIKRWQMRFPDKIRYYVMQREKNKVYNPIFRASANRLNIAVRARGEYITFLDGDDFYVDIHKFQRQIEILEQDENSDCSICMHNMNYFFSVENCGKKFDYDLREGKIEGRSFWKRYYMHAEACIFRNFFQGKIPSFVNPRYFDDNIIVYIGLLYGDIYYIPDVMASYRQNETAWKKNSDFRINLINLLDYDQEILLNPSMKRASAIRHYSALRSLMKRREDFKKEKFDDLHKQAISDNAKLAIDVIEYDEANLRRKLRIRIEYLGKTLIFLKWRIDEKVKNLL